jgi:hypothetical protein
MVCLLSLSVLFAAGWFLYMVCLLKKRKEKRKKKKKCFAKIPHSLFRSNKKREELEMRKIHPITFFLIQLGKKKVLYKKTKRNCRRASRQVLSGHYQNSIMYSI